MFFTMTSTVPSHAEPNDSPRDEVAALRLQVAELQAELQQAYAALERAERKLQLRDNEQLQTSAR